MKFFSILSGSIALAASLGQAQETQKFDTLWSKCKKDADCVLVEGVCSGLRGVNKKYERESKSYFHWLNATTNCAVMGRQKVEKPNVTCVKETCEAK